MPECRIHEGDCREVLRSLPAGSVHTVVTSPPYFGLRDYGTGEWDGGDPVCDHVAGMARQDTERETPGGRGGSFRGGTVQFRDVCGKCSAVRVDRQIGLEPTPDEFVAALVAVFREVRRVLRDDGTVWLNLGDSYCNVPSGNHSSQRDRPAQDGAFRVPSFETREQSWIDRGRADKLRLDGVKQKDLLGVPWMVAFALRADGWYLRSDIIWNKPNPMPESVTDRPTKSHEYVFLLSKGPRYFYDADAIRETWADERNGASGAVSSKYADPLTFRQDGGVTQAPTVAGRNKRSVWTVATQPYAGAHFATFPPKLIEPCILAGAPERACGECGAPWVRVVERQNESTYAQIMREHGITYREMKAEAEANGITPGNVGGTHRPGRRGETFASPQNVTKGFELSCAHGDGSASGVVLDPFAGAGTTGLVALQHGRDFIGIELNPAYAAMARERIETAVRLGFRSPSSGPEQIPGQVSIFDLNGNT